MLSTYYVLGILLDAKESTVNKTDKALLPGIHFLVEETDQNQINVSAILKHVNLSAREKGNEVEQIRIWYRGIILYSVTGDRLFSSPYLKKLLLQKYSGLIVS